MNVQDVWAARKAEQDRLLMYTRQRRSVYATMGGKGAERAVELDILMMNTELLIAELTDQLCEMV